MDGLNPFANLNHKCVVVLIDQRLDRVRDVLQHVCNRDFLDIKFNLADFDLGQVQNVID